MQRLSKSQLLWWECLLSLPRQREVSTYQRINVRAQTTGAVALPQPVRCCHAYGRPPERLLARARRRARAPAPAAERRAATPMASSWRTRRPTAPTSTTQKNYHGEVVSNMNSDRVNNVEALFSPNNKNITMTTESEKDRSVRSGRSNKRDLPAWKALLMRIKRPQWKELKKT